jgi:alpha-1,2-mannosyltransferase
VEERLGGIVARPRAPGRTRGLADRLRSEPMRRRGLLLLRASAAAAVLAGILNFVVAPLQGHFTGEFEDFGAYMAAARAVAHHGDVYAQFIHQTPNVALTGFDYPPVVAYLLQPLAWLPASTAAMLWLWLTVACTAVAASIAAFELLPREWPRLELAALATFLYSASTYNYWHGQMNPVIFLLLALALREWLHGHQRRFGVLIGLAATIKLAPIVLIILAIRRGWWRATGAAVVTGGAGLVLGVVTLGTGTLHEYITRVLPVLSYEDGWLYNQSISGVVNRVFDHAVLQPQPGSLVISVVTYGVLAIMVGLLFVAIRGEERPRRLRGGEFAAATLLMLLASTITWYPHYVTSIIVVFAVVGLMASDSSWRSSPLAVSIAVFLATIALFAPVLIANVGSWSQVLAISHTGWWYPLIQVASLPALAATVLFVAMTLRLRTAHAVHVAVQSPTRSVGGRV